MSVDTTDVIGTHVGTDNLPRPAEQRSASVFRFCSRSGDAPGSTLFAYRHAPKNPQQKIMRRLLRERVTNGDVKGDVTTLEDLSVIAKLKEQEEA